MKKIISVFMILLFTVSVSALSIQSDFEERWPRRNVQSCHFELNKGIVCPGLDQVEKPVFEPEEVFTKYETNECFFDSIKGLVCPRLPEYRTTFDRRPYRPFHERGRFKPVGRISKKPPQKITGAFTTHFAQRSTRTRTRLGFHLRDVVE